MPLLCPGVTSLLPLDALRTLQSVLELNSLKARRTFSGAPTLPRGYISSSPGCAEDFAICSCLNSLEGEEDFLSSRLHSLEARRSF